ncbi:hypothetical protein SYYSPA8_24300 [Streptomyces yaizuensis]|uniref:Uncharacterized protein n=1 Tax=Streptomyces yaizuensis TaxID=2989713 RepID=A0ABQ5P4K3_9ACTN|nr:hypothetical protein SYYSPA8_24300 [Streptomyces sp. YSPA8]
MKKLKEGAATAVLISAYLSIVGLLISAARDQL